MREYELTVVYDLAVAEAGGPDAGPQRIASLVEGRGGKMLKVDHWGRRRMAYPIGKALDGDYVVTRVELDPSAVAPLEADAAAEPGQRIDDEADPPFGTTHAEPPSMSRLCRSPK